MRLQILWIEFGIHFNGFQALFLNIPSYALTVFLNGKSMRNMYILALMYDDEIRSPLSEQGQCEYTWRLEYQFHKDKIRPIICNSLQRKVRLSLIFHNYPVHELELNEPSYSQANQNVFPERIFVVCTQEFTLRTTHWANWELVPSGRSLLLNLW